MVQTILDANAVEKAIKNMAEEIFKDNENIAELAFIGIHAKGVFIAKRLLEKIAEFAKINPDRIPFGTLDITLYRDDLDDFGSDMPVIKDTIIPFDISQKNIILVDDVLYTGRTVRAALDILTDFGRPKRIRLAVLVDRGFRELPIEADYAGVKYESKDNIKVECAETEKEDRVIVLK
jgi:pyrimidine operon attenuation protein/uracil phosphoribosyltransferase